MMNHSISVHWTDNDEIGRDLHDWFLAVPEFAFLYRVAPPSLASFHHGEFSSYSTTTVFFPLIQQGTFT